MSHLSRIYDDKIDDKSPKEKLEYLMQEIGGQDIEPFMTELDMLIEILVELNNAIVDGESHSHSIN